MRLSGVDGGDALFAYGEVSGDGQDAAPGEDYGSRLAEIFFPELAEWAPVLNRLHLTPQAAVDVAVRARANGVSLQSELLASGLDEDRLVRAIADHLGLAVVAAIDPGSLIIDDEHLLVLLRGRSGQVPVKLMDKDGSISFLITSERMRLDFMHRQVRTRPALAARLKLVNPKLLRAAVLARAKAPLTRIATIGLFERFPDLSARIVINAWQGAMVGFVVTILPLGLLIYPGETFLALHALATFSFFACIALRFAAVASVQQRSMPPQATPLTDDMPVYSVLIALYQEAALVPHIIEAMDRLIWPRDRLEVRLVCEADDAPTLAAVRAANLPPHVEMIVVPSVGPRTKPKALSYALPMVGGEFITLYDAEDEPHPIQLVEAWQRFRKGGAELAALQAPLEISNRGGGIIARMFAFEYAALFRGLLPWLSRRRLVLPLGGTSNHFRRAALDDVGGWDPFNVTEDADLGVRLARFGYRTGTISSPTYESAPMRFSVWLPQRTRWFKGWSQTWLVHMRKPVRFAGELGFGSFLVAQVLFIGMVASALLHPLLLVTIAYLVAEMMSDRPSTAMHSLLLLFDAVNIACGYLSFLLLGWQTLTRSEKKGFWKIVLFTPVYWMMMSVAGWRSVWKLWRQPHYWEKTPHEFQPLPPARESVRPRAIFPENVGLRR